VSGVTTSTVAIANAAPAEVTVRSVEEAWAYLILRRAELDGRIFGLRYEPCRFNLGRTSAGRQSTYVPDFWLIDGETHRLVVVEVVGYHKRERARGEALLLEAFPWMEFRAIDAKLLRNPRTASGSDPIFGGPLPINLAGIAVSVAGSTLAKKAEKKFARRAGRPGEIGDEIALTAREAGEGEPVRMVCHGAGWRRGGQPGEEVESA
jgi:hypothetical protein